MKIATLPMITALAERDGSFWKRKMSLVDSIRRVIGLSE
jgi:hypothetical protein